MKCYEFHEDAYRLVESSESSTWGEFWGEDASYDEFSMKPLLREVLDRVNPSAPNPAALDLGGGTGQVSYYLRSRGYAVSGVDISKTAIEMARKEAAARDVEIDFQVQDVCKLQFEPESFDLILDGICLHCVVFDEDREMAFQGISSLLRSGGCLVVSTMTQTRKLEYPHPYHLDDAGILWFLLDQYVLAPSSRDAAAKLSRDIGGKRYLPFRRVRRPEVLREEISEIGLDVEWEQVADPGRDDTEPLYQALCRKP